MGESPLTDEDSAVGSEPEPSSGTTQEMSDTTAAPSAAQGGAGGQSSESDTPEPESAPSPTVDPDGPLLAVSGPDAVTGEHRIWLLDSEGNRRELSPFSGTFPQVHEAGGELMLTHAASTADGGFQMWVHDVLGSEVLPGTSRTYPASTNPSYDWNYAVGAEVLESESYTFEDGTSNDVVRSRLFVVDTVDATEIPVTEQLPPFSLGRFSVPNWSPVSHELLYPVATNDDIEVPSWELSVVQIDGHDVSDPIPLVENGVWPNWSPEGRWLQVTSITEPWVISSTEDTHHHWLIERGSWQRYDLGGSAAGEQVYWRFPQNEQWLVGERFVLGQGSTEVMYRRIPDGEPVSVVTATGGGRLQVTGNYEIVVVEALDAAGTSLRRHYLDFSSDEPQSMIVEGEHMISWPGEGELVVIYVPDEPGTLPGPETTGTAKVYRKLPTPDNLLFELRLNYWLRASAAGAHFVFHTDEGWFSIAAKANAEAVAIDLGEVPFETTVARLHPELPWVSLEDSSGTNRLLVLSWPNELPQVQEFEFPELAWGSSLWVRPAPVQFAFSP
jgi:hypothetical protein